MARLQVRLDKSLGALASQQASLAQTLASAGVDPAGLPQQHLDYLGQDWSGGDERRAANPPSDYVKQLARMFADDKLTQEHRTVAMAEMMRVQQATGLSPSEAREDCLLLALDASCGKVHRSFMRDAAKAEASASAERLCCGLAACGAREAFPGHFKKCSACIAAVYCSREHQVADWPSHKKACKAARKAAAAAEQAGPSNA